jgi:hypothetical protein
MFLGVLSARRDCLKISLGEQFSCIEFCLEVEKPVSEKHEILKRFLCGSVMNRVQNFE